MATPRRTPPEPVETDEVRVVVVGTVLFLAGLVATLVWAGRPGRLGDGDWPWVMLAGTLLGLVGLRAVRRRRRLRRGDVISDPSGVDIGPNTS